MASTSLTGVLTPTQRIKMQLMLRRMTQRDLARRIGVEESYVSAVIRGARRPLWIRVKIAEALGTHVRDLWPDEIRSERNP